MLDLGIMNNTFWLGVFPGLNEEELGFVAEEIEAFFGGIALMGAPDIT